MLRNTLLIIAIPFLLTPEAYAIKQYRCNGMVQYRPCDESYPRAVVERPRATAVKPEKSSPRGPAPKVFDDSFEQVSPAEGVWRGKVTGNGFVQLSLYIYENGKLTESRYMGGVDLEGNSTFFAFKSVLPTGSNWTWVVRAYI